MREHAALDDLCRVSDDDDDDDDVLSCLILGTPQNDPKHLNILNPMLHICSKKLYVVLKHIYFLPWFLLNSMIYFGNFPTQTFAFAHLICFAIIHLFPKNPSKKRRRENNLGVSKNRGTPKWMVYNGKPY